MSAGAFTTTKYEADNGTIHRIRLQPETVAATDGTTANDPPEEDINDAAVSAKASRGANEIGLRPRAVGGPWNEDGLPDGYKPGSSAEVVVLTPETYAEWTIGTSIDYNGGSFTVQTRRPQDVK